jgi:UDP-N-acetylmuramoyl-L-alanyl-D-glutamate--2,6-diaminopimelate ligase
LLLSQITNTPRDIEITGITADSRQVKKGNLYAALPGSKADGVEFIADAIMHGAVAILAQEGTKLPEGSDAVLITSQNPRQALALMAAKYYGQQPSVIAAVTGTSGKTSTVSFAQQLWTLSGVTQCASLGTLGVRGPGLVRSGSLTTPATVSLHAELADLASVGITHLAMEASSHGLDQYRLDGVHITAAGYSNLSRDHLDYHVDMDDYFRAKSRLFSEVLKTGGVAVLNADDEYYEKLKTICETAEHRILSYGENGADLRLLGRQAKPLGQDIHLQVAGEKFELTLPLVGKFQVMNALLALGLVLASGLEAKNIVPLLEKLEGVPGRLQLVQGHPENAAIYVDYAHKPAAVEAVLNSLRPHTEGRLICLLGCGGDRDKGKRSIMGRIAAGLSDLVIITDDNPRSEDAATIRAEMMEGAPDATEIAGRDKAIAWAVSELKAGDVLVVAGKGHETGQMIKGVMHPFDDVEEVTKAIEKITKRMKV